MIKVSLILLSGLLATSLFRGRSASTRHWVLAWAIACAAVVPALELVVPAWRTPFTAAWMASPASASRLVFGGDPSDAEAARRQSESGAAEPSAPGRRLSSLQKAWLLGAAVSLFVLAAALVRLARIVSKATPVERGPWAGALAEVAGTPHRAAVRLVISQHPTLLFTWGVERPTIVLPASAPTWPAERIRAVLGHELAHVRRRDWAVQMLAELVRCAYWFNPLVWAVCHRLRQTSEQACDDVVLNSGVHPPDYAAHLLDVAQLFREARRPSFLPVMTMIRPSSFERRVRAMLRPGTDRSPISRRVSAAAASALVMLTIPLAGLTVQPASDAPVTVPAGRDVVMGAVAPTDAPGAPTDSLETTPASSRRPAAGKAQAAPAAATSLTGTIRDATGRTVPDVVVDITPVDSPNGPRPQIRTGTDGRFSVTGLPAGEYDVASSKPGFKRNLLRVAQKPGVPATLNVVLQIGSISETIVVTTGRAAVAVAPKPAPGRATAPESRTPGADPCDDSPVGGCVTPPRKLVDTKPVYPPALAASGASANVVVKATLGVDGFLKDFQPDGGPDRAFVEAVLEAVRQWQFTPVRLNGDPQECQVTVTVKFVVQ